uniref:Sterile alpha motif domain containing 12 n=1 Tax=Scleropages formosus TaxID=113540 RepID=A0A8C9TCR2_SCLFO
MRSVMAVEAVHCNLSHNGIDHQVCSEEVPSHLEEEGLDQAPGLDDISPGFQDPRGSPRLQQASEVDGPRAGAVKLTKPVALWTQQDVCKWLKKHCPHQYQIYSNSFKQHDITGAPETAALIGSISGDGPLPLFHGAWVTASSQSLPSPLLSLGKKISSQCHN